MKYYRQIGRTYFFTIITGDGSNSSFCSIYSPVEFNKIFYFSPCRRAAINFGIPSQRWTFHFRIPPDSVLNQHALLFHRTILLTTLSTIQLRLSILGSSTLFSFILFYLLYSFSFPVTTLLLRVFIILLVDSSDDIVFLDLLHSHLHFAVFSFQSYFYFVFRYFLSDYCSYHIIKFTLWISILGSSPFSPLYLFDVF